MSCICKKCVILAIACVVVILLLASNVFFGGHSADKRFFFSVVTQENVTEIPPIFNIQRNIRLVSYNIRCEYFDPRTIWNVNERIESLAEGVKDFDIVLLQEVYIISTGIGVVSKCASLLVKAMSKQGFHYRTSIADLMAPYIGKNGGIVIFSRLPLARTASRQFSNFSILQYADYRGFVVGEYFVSSRHLYVVNTHLDPRQATTRILQTKEIITATKNVTASSHIIVGGDFNIDNNYPTLSNGSEEYIELLETMKRAGLRSVFPSRMETNIDGGNYDAMFASSNIAVVRREIIKLVTTSNAVVSDHFGIAVELKLL